MATSGNRAAAADAGKAGAAAVGGFPNKCEACSERCRGSRCDVVSSSGRFSSVDDAAVAMLQVRREDEAHGAQCERRHGVDGGNTANAACRETLRATPVGALTSSRGAARADARHVRRIQEVCQEASQLREGREECEI